MARFWECTDLASIRHLPAGEPPRAAPGPALRAAASSAPVARMASPTGRPPGLGAQPPASPPPHLAWPCGSCPGAGSLPLPCPPPRTRQVTISRAQRPRLRKNWELRHPPLLTPRASVPCPQSPSARKPPWARLRPQPQTCLLYSSVQPCHGLHFTLQRAQLSG